MSKPTLHERTSRDWEELRTVLAVARSGSLSGAARELGLEHSTVYRRIESIEDRFGVKLFERSRSGYLANAQGEAVVEAARAMEDAALSAERRIFGADELLKGSIRVATSELFASHLLPAVICEFMGANPEIRLEIDVSNRPVDLTRREADLALRGCEVPPEHLIGQCIARIQYAIYIGRNKHRMPRSLEELPWLGFDDALAQIPQARWWRGAFPNVVPRLWFNSLTAMQEAASAGLGAAVLPCFSAATDPNLVRVTEVLPSPEAGVWLLRHPDVRGNARVRAFADHIARRMPSHVQALVERGARQKKELLPCPGKSVRRKASDPAKGQAD